MFYNLLRIKTKLWCKYLVSDCRLRLLLHIKCQKNSQSTIGYRSDTNIYTTILSLSVINCKTYPFYSLAFVSIYLFIYTILLI